MIQVRGLCGSFRVGRLLVLFLTLLFLSLSGCRPGEKSKAEGQKGDRDVLAMVGDQTITREDFERAMDFVPENSREGLKSKVLDRLIRDKVFSAEAVGAGLGEDPQVKEDMDSVKDDLLARLYVKQYVDKEAEPSDEAIRQYYEEHKEEFRVPDGVLVQHILVKKRQEAEVVLKELKAGTSFDALANKKSVPDLWKEGSSMGWQYRGSMEPAVEKIAFGLEKGQLSDIIETDKGFQIVKVFDKKDKREVPFEEVRAGLRGLLLSEKREELSREYYETAGVNRAPQEAGALAKIGDEVISEKTLAPVRSRLPDKEKGKDTSRLVDYLIDKKVFSREAKKAGLDKDPDVAARLDMIREQILAKTFYDKFLENKFKIEDRDILDFYNTHQVKFKEPVWFRIRSILVKTKEEAEAVLKELEKGAFYDDMAVKHSLHPLAAERAGLIGWLSQGEIDPALEKVAMVLEEGQRSGIVKTQAGYEIMELVKRGGGKGVKPLNGKLKKSIRKDLLGEKLREEKQVYYEKAGVKVFGF